MTRNHGSRFTLHSVKIGELAQRAGIGVSTVRFYEKQGLMPVPERRESGYRDYSERDLERLRLIVAAKRQRFPLRLIRVVVGAFEGGENPCEEVAALVCERLKSLRGEIEGLQRVEQTLQTQLRRWEKGELPTADCMCGILQSLGN